MSTVYNVEANRGIVLDAQLVVGIAAVVADVDSEASNAVFSGDAAPRRSKSKEIFSPPLSVLSSVYLIYTRVRMYTRCVYIRV